ncbi:MAG TPA: hypothetical protein VMU17_02705 [Elusimicrobiota bacterium]|nr:hypothetical protein [Elusimicrobiota bacterium]
MRARWTCFALLAAAGCVRTEITRESSSYVEFPFQKMLICSMTADPSQASRFEDLLAGRLKRHHLEVATCSVWAGGREAMSGNDVLNQLRSSGFDSVLIMQRKQGSRNSPWPPESAFPSFQDFWRAYQHLDRRPQPEPRPEENVPGDYILQGRGQMISVARNSLIWSFDGLAEGLFTHSIAKFMKTVNRRLERELTEENLIRSR